MHQKKSFAQNIDDDLQGHSKKNILTEVMPLNKLWLRQLREGIPYKSNKGALLKEPQRGAKILLSGCGFFLSPLGSTNCKTTHFHTFYLWIWFSNNSWYIVWLNTLKGTSKAAAIDLLRLYTPRFDHQPLFEKGAHAPPPKAPDTKERGNRA